jgi:hypothetical protein
MDLNAATELTLATAAGIAVARLVGLGLAGQFPALLVYLALMAVMNLSFGLLNPASSAYFWTYFAFEPLYCILSIIAVRELFALTFRKYPGIRTLGRGVMYAGVALALGISFLLTGAFWSGTARGRAHSRVFYLEISQRSVVFSLALIIVAILFVLSKYPLHLRRDTLVSSAFFSILLLSEAVQLLLDSLAPRLFNQYVDWTAALFMSLCLFGWAALLKPESASATAPVKASSSREDYLLEQLNSLNQLMTRAARR